MSNGYCTVCPKKCHHSQHTNADFYFVETSVKTWVTLDHIYIEYKAAETELIKT